MSWGTRPETALSQVFASRASAGVGAKEPRWVLDRVPGVRHQLLREMRNYLVLVLGVELEASGCSRRRRWAPGDDSISNSGWDRPAHYVKSRSLSDSRINESAVRLQKRATWGYHRRPELHPPNPYLCNK